MKIKAALLTAAAACFLMLPTLAHAEDSSASEASKKFDKLDTNHDGKISHDEWMAHAEAQFKKICADGDDAISRDEWNKWLEEEAKEDAAKAAKQ